MLFGGKEELFKTAFGTLRSLGEISRAMGPLILIAHLVLQWLVELASSTLICLVAFTGWITAGWFALSFPNLPPSTYAHHDCIPWYCSGWYHWCGIPWYFTCLPWETSEVIVTIMMNLYRSIYLVMPLSIVS